MIRVILDVTDLRFIDSTGLRMVVVEHGHSTTDGFEFVIAGPSATILRTLRIGGLDVTLPLAPDLANALGNTGDGPTQTG